MPSPAPLTSEQCAAQLQALGAQIRAQRKALRLSATVTAEAAGLSRVTLHRIEKGEPSVTMGAWCNAMAALGMGLQATPSTADTAKPAPDRTGWIPARVPLADYPPSYHTTDQVHLTRAVPVEVTVDSPLPPGVPADLQLATCPTHEVNP